VLSRGATASARRGWPRRDVDLLLRATLLPADEARAAFARWAAERDFEAISWEEMRLLTPLARRKDIGLAESPLTPRILGVSRYLWARTQIRVARSIGAIEALAAAGIETLVFKGAALHAAGLASESGRVFSDLDALVRPGEFLAALECLLDAGWAAGTGRSNAETRRLAATRAGLNLSCGKDGEVDLHNAMFHYARRDAAADEDLWARARPAVLAGRPVRVPDPEHALVAQFAHSCYSEAGDWAIDCFVRAGAEAIDWPRLIDLADRRGLLPVVERRLAYLVEALRFDLPAEARQALAARPRRVAERLKAYALLAPRQNRRPLDRVAGFVADRLLPRRSYAIERKQSARPKFVLPAAGRRLRGAATPAAVLPLGPTLEATLRFARPLAGGRLFVELEIAPDPARRKAQFELRLGDESVAILKARLRPVRRGGERRLAYRVRLPDGAGEAAMHIVALANRAAAADAAPSFRAANDPLPFIVRTAALGR